MLVAGMAASLLSAGCANVSHQERVDSAHSLVSSSGWVTLMTPDSPYPLWSAQPRDQHHSRDLPSLVVYLEGDGLAWLSRNQPSLDPTPVQPVSLQLALAHPRAAGEAVAYLGRPCQYMRGSHCRTALWTSHRFSAEVVASTQAAIDQIKTRAGAQSITLVGHSGGGVLAALVAARRNDVERLVTIASPLDHARWTRELRLTPLTGSLNPIHDIDRLRQIDQVHVIGLKDAVVPPSVVRGFVGELQSGSTPSKTTEVIELDGFDHLCCWTRDWPGLHRTIWGSFRTPSAQ